MELLDTSTYSESEAQNGSVRLPPRTFVYTRRRLINGLVIGIFDVIALLIAAMVAGWLRYLLFKTSLMPAWVAFVIPGWLVLAYTDHLLPSWGLGVVEEVRRIVMLLVGLFATTTVVLFLLDSTNDTSRFMLLVYFLVSIPSMLYLRNVAKRLLIRFGQWGIPAVIYGGSKTGAAVLRALAEEPGLGYYPIGVFDDNEGLWGKSISGVPVIGGTDLATSDATVAILAMPGISRHRTMELFEGPLATYSRTVIIPNLIGLPSLWVRSRDFAGLLGLEITQNLLNPYPQWFKRIFDILAVVCTIPFWVPLIGLIALAIRIEGKGRVFYRQTRIGREEQPFRIYKFRTMIPNAEKVLADSLERDPELRTEWVTRCKLQNDPRITRVGRFLRNNSLDELPQLINVLKGDMSLVGPRPLPIYHFRKMPGRVRVLRNKVRPGMSGLWQVSGRSDTGNQGMIRFDSFYVRNWSFWLDLVILVRTIRVVTHGAGAY